MNREDLLALCERFAERRHSVLVGRVSIDVVTVDPVPEIMRSFRHAEISESEKNALLSLVCDADEEADFCAETCCVRDPYADTVVLTGDEED